jgi:hypothetical protein
MRGNYTLEFKKEAVTLVGDKPVGAEQMKPTRL